MFKQFFKIQPFVWCIFNCAIIEIEPVDIDVSSHNDYIYK